MREGEQPERIRPRTRGARNDVVDLLAQPRERTVAARGDRLTGPRRRPVAMRDRRVLRQLECGPVGADRARSEHDPLGALWQVRWFEPVFESRQSGVYVRSHPRDVWA